VDEAAVRKSAAGIAGAGAHTATQAVVDLARGSVELGSSLSGTLRATWHRPLTSGLGPLASDLDGDQPRVIVTLDPAAVAGPLVANTLADAITRPRRPAPARPDRLQPGHPEVEIRLATCDRLAAPPPQSFTPTLPRWRVVAPARSPRPWSAISASTWRDAASTSRAST
jgi:hypothetical protein